MFPDVVLAICEVLTVSRNGYPLAKNLVLTSCASILDSVDPQADDSVDATDMSTVD